MTSTTSEMRSSRGLFAAEPGAGAFVIFLVLLLAFRLVLLALSDTELYFDEAQYWAWSKQPAFGYYTKPPLLAWVIGLTTGVCGDSPFCARLGAPLLHAASALVAYAIARKLFDRRIAFWTGIVYLTTPGAAVSAMLISTDVPLLFFWTVALLATVHHVERPTWLTGAVIGIAIGLGMNAKYAMVYFVLCFALYCAFEPRLRRLLVHPATLAALAIAALLILPNVLWNAGHGFATFSHTRDNASWDNGRFPNISGMLEFIGTQAVIIGPVPFVALIVALLGRADFGKRAELRLLLFFSIPVFALITLQALIAKANGNWAATAFPAAAIAATAVMVSLKWWRGMVFTLVLSTVTTIAVPLSTVFADRFTSGPIAGEMGKLRGWSTYADNVRRIAAATGIDTVVFCDRGLTAAMLYELRDSGLNIRRYTANPQHPADHFQMTIPWTPSDARPVLIFVTHPYHMSAVETVAATPVETFDAEIYLAKRNGWKSTAYRVD
ncbi:MAG: glycosyltransferase family 39 protein [Burkholderiaceae bacterium]|nr:glycosyltransferase family 39 protein [Burkholderiaceae bacterium]